MSQPFFVSHDGRPFQDEMKREPHEESVVETSLTQLCLTAAEAAKKASSKGTKNV